MFGFGSSTPTSARSKRAQLRQKRKLAVSSKKTSTPKKSGHSSPPSADEDVLVVSGVTTLLVALFVVAVGAVFAVVFFAIYSPDCLKGILPFSSQDTSGNRLRRLEMVPSADISTKMVFNDPFNVGTTDEMDKKGERSHVTSSFIQIDA